jgi:hypothetical protein
MIDTLLEISQSYLVCESKVDAVLLRSEVFRQLSVNLLFDSEEQLSKGSTLTVHRKYCQMYCFAF